MGRDESTRLSRSRCGLLRVVAAATIVWAMLAGSTTHAQVPFVPLLTVDRSLGPMEWLGPADDGRWTFRPLSAKTGDSSSDVAVAHNEVVVWGNPAEPVAASFVVLVDETVLAIDDFSSDAETLSVATRLFGRRMFPLTQVRGIVFRSPASTLRRDRLFDAVAHPADGDRDRLSLSGGDELAGSVTSMDTNQIALETELGATTKATLESVSLVFNPALADKVELPKERLIVGLRDGSRLVCRSVVPVGQSVTLEPALPGNDAAKQPWMTTRTAFVFLQPLGGAVRYLSDVEPTGYRHVPYLLAQRPYALDRNLDGGRLRAGGKSFLKGIAMPSTSRLAFPLDGSTARFRAEIAVDDAAGLRGSVTFRVFVDAEERYRSEIVRGGDAPTPVNVDIAGGKQLSLVVDFAEYGDEQDHALWLNARLQPK